MSPFLTLGLEDATASPLNENSISKTNFSYNFVFSIVVLHGCETLSLPLREGHRLRVSENRVLRRTFGPKRDEVKGGWRKLHNEKLHNVYSSPCIIRMKNSRRMKWAGHGARIGEKRNAYIGYWWESQKERDH
jgi:hypothetical protein